MSFYYHMFFVLVLLTSCGSKLNPIPKEAEKFYNEVKCSSNQDIRKIPAYSDILELEKRLSLFSYKCVNDECIDSLLGKASCEDDSCKSKRSVDEPLILNEEGFSDQYKKIITTIESTSLNKSLGKFIKRESLDNTPVLNAKEQQYIVDIKKEISLYKTGVERFYTFQCDFQNLSYRKKQDLRGYFSLRDDVCLKDNNCLTAKDEINKSKESFMKLCANFHTPFFCTQEWQINYKNKNSPKAFDFYLDRNKKQILDPLFQIVNDDTIKKFQCQKNLGKISLRVPFVLPLSLKDSADEIEDFIEKTWSNENLSVDLVEAVGQKNTVSVKLIDRMASYVESNNRLVINLSSVLRGEHMKKILAHEFGHVLGFPDCYIHFYESDTKSYVYYELNESENLMCSTENSIVPTNYFSEIENKLCTFD